MSKSTLRRLGRTMRDDDALEFLADYFPCVANLLRVARAGAYIIRRKGHPIPCEKGQIYCELHKALKEVKHLL